MPARIAPHGEIARELEALQLRGVVTIDDPNSPMAYYGLTRPGRDIMLQYPKAAAAAKPPPAIATTAAGYALRALANPKHEPDA